jgi:hypothetical protein
MSFYNAQGELVEKFYDLNNVGQTQQNNIIKGKDLISSGCDLGFVYVDPKSKDFDCDIDSCHMDINEDNCDHKTERRKNNTLLGYTQYCDFKCDSCKCKQNIDLKTKKPLVDPKTKKPMPKKCYPIKSVGKHVGVFTDANGGAPQPEPGNLQCFAFDKTPDKANQFTNQNTTCSRNTLQSTLNCVISTQEEKIANAAADAQALINSGIASEQVTNAKLPPMNSHTAVSAEESKINNEHFLDFAPATYDTQAPFYDQRVFRTFWF